MSRTDRFGSEARSETPPGGPSVVCLHGFTGLPESWNRVIAALPENVRVERPYLLGHDPEGTLGASTFEGEIDRLAEDLRTGDLRRSHLAGYSQGARLALGLLVRHPALFASATLVGGSPGLISEPERHARREADSRLAERLEREGIERFLDDWESLPLFASQRRLPDSVLAAQRALRRRHRPGGLARALRVLGLGRMPDYRPELPRIDVPVTLMAGELDEKFCRLARQMAELLPRSTVEILPSAGHNLLLEAPEKVAAVIFAALFR